MVFDGRLLIAGIANAMFYFFRLFVSQRLSRGLRRSFDRQKKVTKKTLGYVLILRWIVLEVGPVVAGSALMPIGNSERWVCAFAFFNTSLRGTKQSLHRQIGFACLLCIA